MPNFEVGGVISKDNDGSIRAVGHTKEEIQARDKAEFDAKIAEARRAEEVRQAEVNKLTAINKVIWGKAEELIALAASGVKPGSGVYQLAQLELIKKIMRG